jgi:hypothetical protein
MTFSDEVMQVLTGLQTDPNFEIVATLKQMSVTKDVYGNRLDSAHTETPLVGWVNLRKAPRQIIAEGIDPRMFATFITYDLTTNISLEDKLICGGLTYAITTIERVPISNKDTYRTLDLEMSRESADIEAGAPSVEAIGEANPVTPEGWGD